MRAWPARQAEAAWRARHKWAARRLAHLLSDVHDAAPLAPVFDVLETLSLNIGLAVDGRSVSALTTPGAGGFGAWAAPLAGGGRFAAVGSLRTCAPVQAPAGEPTAASGRAVRALLY